MFRPKLLVLICGALVTGCARPPKKINAAPPAVPACNEPDDAPPRVEQLASAIEARVLPVVQIRGEEQFFSLETLMKELKVPAVSIAVIEQGQVVWAKAYGVREQGRSAGVNTQTRFQAASISKPVNALTVLRVAQEKGLDLDAPVNGYLKSWRIPKHEWSESQPVTLRHLLSHTGGTTVHGFSGYQHGAPFPSTTQILSGQSPSNSPRVFVDKTPGASFRYSGGGTVITQLMLEDQLGRPYPDIASKYALTPLKMTHSSFAQPQDAATLALAAVGHDANGSVIPGKYQVHPEMAAAGLWTTPTDLAQFLIAVAKARKGQAGPISPETAKQMTKIQFSLGDPGMGMGLGPFLRSFNGHPAFGHGGSNRGYRCEMIAGLDGRFGYAIMTNSDNGDVLIQAISRTLLSQPGWPGGYETLERVPMSAQLQDTVRGTYSSGGLDVFAIASKANRLTIQRPFQEPEELVHLGKNRFVNRSTRTFLELQDTAQGPALSIEQEREPTRSAKRLATPSPLWELYQGRQAQAVAAWKTLATTTNPEPLEAQLNRLGYQLASRQKLDDALKVLSFVTQVRPKSSNAFDSLAEIQALRGERAQAIKSYETSLKLLEQDPKADKTRVDSTRTRVQATIERLRKP